jgi:hypothetical protein
MAMVLTRQKPTQRTRFGELSEGLPGSTVERGMRGEKRQARGRPVGFWLREGHGVWHTDIEPRKGKPGDGRRPEPTRHGQPPQPVSTAEQKRGEAEDLTGVGSPQSTRGTGEPSTGGRG